MLFVIHHTRPVVRSHMETRCSILGPTQSRMSPSMLEYMKKIDGFVPNTREIDLQSPHFEEIDLRILRKPD